MDEAFDYVIVGAGSAGCVLADRLTEDGQHTVLVLEYGGSDRSIFVQMPSRALHPDGHGEVRLALLHRAGAAASAGAACTRRAARCWAAPPRSTASSTCAAMPQDFERWEAEGAAGWGYAARAALLPARRDARRGRRRVPRRLRAAADALRHARESAVRGLARGGARRPATRRRADINGFQQEGFGRMDMTVARTGGAGSAANAYLRPAMKRPNLAVRTQRARDAHPVRRTPRRSASQYRQGDATRDGRARAAR